MHRSFLLLYLLHGCWSTRPPPINKLISIETNCSRDLFHIKLDVGKPFKGVVFAKDFSEECRTKGNFSSTVELTLPVSSCGVRSEPSDSEESMIYSVRLVIQMDGKLRQKSDFQKIIKCTLPSEMMMNVIGAGSLGDSYAMEKKSSFRSGRMRYDVATPAPRVRVWLELGGTEGVPGSVEVGQATTLGVRALLPRNIGVRVIDCAALDGLGEASQKLLDERGCPIDEQVMPALLIRLRPAEEGWSKPNEEDLVEKLFTSTFPAFKFPDRDRLHVSCGVQLCRGKCPRIDCKKNESFHLSPDKQLARIEVFNSLAVIAPQIELERLQREKKSNGTNVEEFPVRSRDLKSEGILCMSQSKLALAFCILGSIFLLAVVVSIVCMLRSRLNKTNSVRGTGSVFSSSSSSNSRTAGSSKLFIPQTPGGSLPYGRVY